MGWGECTYVSGYEDEINKHEQAVKGRYMKSFKRILVDSALIKSLGSPDPTYRSVYPSPVIIKRAFNSPQTTAIKSQHRHAIIFSNFIPIAPILKEMEWAQTSSLVKHRQKEKSRCAFLLLID